MCVAPINLQYKKMDKYIYFMCGIIKKGIIQCFFFFRGVGGGGSNNFYFLVHISQGIVIGSTRNIGGKFVTLLLKDSALFAYINWPTKWILKEIEVYIVSSQYISKWCNKWCFMHYKITSKSDIILIPIIHIT